MAAGAAAAASRMDPVAAHLRDSARARHRRAAGVGGALVGSELPEPEPDGQVRLAELDRERALEAAAKQMEMAAAERDDDTARPVPVHDRKPKISNLGGPSPPAAGDVQTPRRPPVDAVTGQARIEPGSLMELSPGLADQWDWATAEATTPWQPAALDPVAVAAVEAAAAADKAADKDKDAAACPEAAVAAAVAKLEVDGRWSARGVFPWVKLPPGELVPWRCNKGGAEGEPDEHRWLATVADRQENPDCPCCGRDQAAANFEFSLAARRPELAEEWHHEYNSVGGTPPTGSPPALPGPETVHFDSPRTVWWRCKAGPDHVFSMTVKARATDGAACPFCANKKVSVTNSLQTVFPELAAQWHPTLNGPHLTANDVTFTSTLEVWWQMPFDGAHGGKPVEWKAAVSKRTRGSRFFGILRQRARAADAVLSAQQAEALANTREKRRQARRSRRQIMASASASAVELKAARAEAVAAWQADRVI
eukprot:SAG22_NODE_608_length_8601_cov_24.764291_2_plen_481_part_00